MTKVEMEEFKKLAIENELLKKQMVKIDKFINFFREEIPVSDDAREKFKKLETEVFALRS